MKVLLSIFFCFCCLSVAFAQDDCPTDGKVLFCYFSSWAIYREGYNFTIEEIDPNMCTHLVYAFSGLSIYGGIESLDSYADITLGGYSNFVALKNQNPCLKTLLAIGGWNQGSRPYSVMVSSESNREAFADSVLRYIAVYDFDGLDLDWEYPTQRGGIPVDKENLGALIKTLKERLAKWNLLLTIAVPMSTSIAEEAYDMEMINNYIDYVLIMGYDYTPTDSSVTGLLSPLTAVQSAVEYWTQYVPSSKVVLGVPAYGRSFVLSDQSDNSIGAAVDGPGEAGTYTQEAGFLSYLEVRQKLNSLVYTAVSVADEQNYYAYFRTDWIVYETEDNYRAKARYAIETGLAGMMVWSIDTDDFVGRYNSTYAIVNSLKDELFP